MATSTDQRAEIFCLQDIVRQMKTEASRAVDIAAQKAERKSDDEFLTKLRQQYGGKTLFCYDESHENRFVRKSIREWNAIGYSFKECIDRTRVHIFRYKGEEQWLRIERQLEGLKPEAEPILDPEQMLVFQAGNYWYCFFCISGDAFCDLVAERLASERKHDADQTSQCRGEGIDTDFN